MTGLLICAALAGVGAWSLLKALDIHLMHLGGAYRTAVAGFAILGLALIAAALYLAWRAGGAA